jgi:hypothetical protein
VSEKDGTGTSCFDKAEVRMPVPAELRLLRAKCTLTYELQLYHKDSFDNHPLNRIKRRAVRATLPYHGSTSRN